MVSQMHHMNDHEKVTDQSPWRREFRSGSVKGVKAYLVTVTPNSTKSITVICVNKNETQSRTAIKNELKTSLVVIQ